MQQREESIYMLKLQQYGLLKALLVGEIRDTLCSTHTDIYAADVSGKRNQILK